MIHSYDQLLNIAQEYNLPVDEVVFVGLNLCGVNFESTYKRVRFEVEYCNQMLLFSVENNPESPYVIKDTKLSLYDHFLFDVSSLCEDLCEIFYTRKNGSVICFNPNNRSSCEGCSFCYQPSSRDQRKINPHQIKSTFEEWMYQNNKTSLSDIEQISVVTGCFSQDKQVVDYLVKLRESLASLGFSNEIFFMGIVQSKECLKQLAKINPIQLCYTIECFERRQLMLSDKKNIDISVIDRMMKFSMYLGIKTTFSYVLGLDSLDSIKNYFPCLMGSITSFPIISLYQTDSRRMVFRNQQANQLCYYLKCRRIIEDMCDYLDLRPNYWNNYRSLWRTCYGKNNESILPVS